MATQFDPPGGEAPGEVEDEEIVIIEIDSDEDE